MVAKRSPGQHYYILNTGGQIIYNGTTLKTRHQSLVIEEGTPAVPGKTRVPPALEGLMEEGAHPGRKGQRPGYLVRYLKDGRLAIVELDGNTRKKPRTSDEVIEAWSQKRREEVRRGRHAARFGKKPDAVADPEIPEDEPEAPADEPEVTDGGDDSPISD